MKSAPRASKNGPTPFFRTNPARHKMMVYAGHVPTHFMPEISRGMQNPKRKQSYSNHRAKLAVSFLEGKLNVCLGTTTSPKNMGGKFSASIPPLYSCHLSVHSCKVFGQPVILFRYHLGVIKIDLDSELLEVLMLGD